MFLFDFDVKKQHYSPMLSKVVEIIKAANLK